MPDNLYVAWQDAETRAWHTVGRLSRAKDGYEFQFTRGVRRLKTIPADVFRADVNGRYLSTELMPLFQNRLPSKSRSDFAKMAAWLNLQGNEDEFDLLARFGLIPGTDSILVYPEPQVIDGKYRLEFFVHGIRHMHADAVVLCDGLKAGDRLLPLLDLQNPVDPNAVAVRPKEHSVLIGYVPTFYASDLRHILADVELAARARVTVVQNNKDAPIQLRLLCRFEAEVPSDFRSLATEVHSPMVSETAPVKADTDMKSPTLALCLS